jgi:hypothetical protein
MNKSFDIETLALIIQERLAHMPDGPARKAVLNAWGNVLSLVSVTELRSDCQSRSANEPLECEKTRPSSTTELTSDVQREWAYAEAAGIGWPGYDLIREAELRH